MSSGIYSIINKANGKRYIGQAYDINHRLNKHFNALKRNSHMNKHLQSSFNEYGEKSFKTEILKVCKKRYLNRFEKLYIKKYNSDNPKYGYNKTKGGENPPILSKEKNWQYRYDIHNKESEICNKYENGISCNALSKEYDCNYWTIKNILIKNNIPIRNVSQTNKRNDVWVKEKEVCEYYLKGNSLEKASLEFDVSVNVIVNILDKNNIKRRSNKELLKGKHNSVETEFKKGIIPHNKGKSKIELAGGIDYIKECISKDMSKQDILEELGYKNFGSVASFLAKHNTNFTKLYGESYSKYKESGYYGVTIVNRPRCKNGYAYRYKIPNKPHAYIERVDLKELEKQVKAKGLEWFKIPSIKKKIIGENK